MLQTTDFAPDWISPPGETIMDMLEEQNMSLTDLARGVGSPLSDMRGLLDGRTALTSDIAKKLEEILGGSAAFWMIRETQYRTDAALLQEERKFREDAERWLDEIPLEDMVRFDWIKRKDSLRDKVVEALGFFGVSDIRTWHETYDRVFRAAAFRTSATFESKAGAVAAWLRRAEIESHAIECDPWDPAKFEEMLTEIRSLTRKKQPRVFIPALQKLCAGCGVAAVIIRAPNGCRASGATRFLTPQKALLTLSFRFLSDDHFWFTFFHEAGHLLLHPKNELFLEGAETESSKEEKEANDFAARVLIPVETEAAIRRLPLDGREVLRFARKIGVSPGIVVGQMQHRGLITHRQLNNLKTRYRWDGDENG
jgi:HTH-type transcriptional regulator/antitoxin HigA